MTQDRAQEIFENAKRKGGWNWIEYLDDEMSDDERQYVHSVWDRMSGNASFWDAFNKIRQGRV